MIVREEKFYQLILTSDITAIRSSLKSLCKSMGLREGVSSSLKDMFCAYLFLLT